MSKVVLAVLLLLCIPPGAVGAAETLQTGEEEPLAMVAYGQERPKIGLVLSGGGARGGAHVGVLKALEELNVPIDYIAGTSMGAIIGGFYAAGYSSDELEIIMQEMDWSAALSDQPDRRDRTMRKKELEFESFIPHRIGFNKGSIQLPLGVIEGQHLDQIFHRILMPVRGIDDFDQLSIPFRAVATDLVTGKEVVLSSGSLADALRASMSVPGVFSPVRLNGRLLVDGGMSNNLPVSVVREMGADIVIAIDISSPLFKEDELKSVLSVTGQLSNFLTRNNLERQIASLKATDILLVPDLAGASSADFEAAGKLADIGYVAVMSEQDTFLALAMPPESALPARPELELSPENYVVRFVEIDNQSVLDDELIRSRLDIPLGKALDLDALETSVDQIYSLDVFESVTYDLVRNQAGEQGVRIHALPRRWGPNYLQLGLEFSDDFSGTSEYKLGVAYTRNAFNSLGGELRVVAAIGRESELSFDFYQPIDKKARWFVQPELFGLRERFNVWEDDVQIAALEISGAGVRLGLGRNFSTTDLIRMDYHYFRGTGEIITGSLGFPWDDRVRVGELNFEYRHDSLDNPWFPGKGTFHRLGYRYASEALGASADYQQAFGAGSWAISGGKNSFLLNYELGYSFDDDVPVERWFELGGFGRLSGLIPDQISGRQLGLLSLAYHRRLNDIDFIPAYAGVTLETGNVWQTSDAISFSDLRYSSSIFIGARTPLGPVYLAWGYSDNGDSTLYFYLGNPFRTNRF